MYRAYTDSYLPAFTTVLIPTEGLSAFTEDHRLPVDEGVFLRYGEMSPRTIVGYHGEAEDAYK